MRSQMLGRREAIDVADSRQNRERGEESNGGDLHQSGDRRVVLGATSDEVVQLCLNQVQLVV